MATLHRNRRRQRQESYGAKLPTGVVLWEKAVWVVQCEGGPEAGRPTVRRPIDMKETIAVEPMMLVRKLRKDKPPDNPYRQGNYAMSPRDPGAEEGDRGRRQGIGLQLKHIDILMRSEFVDGRRQGFEDGRHEAEQRYHRIYEDGWGDSAQHHMRVVAEELGKVVERWIGTIETLNENTAKDITKKNVLETFAEFGNQFARVLAAVEQP
jgi:hypothetical protein